MIVFAGPSVAGVDRDAYPGLRFHPPARQGDVWRAVQDAPTAIGIIDGFFEGVPAIWHKEILWALHEGVPVLGASSMGALRAAEMDAFGMIGVGRIFRWYRDGVIEDDDEVALVHGPEEIGSPALSLPMVNVRATAEAAIAAGNPIGDLISVAKAQFYKARTWNSVLEGSDLTAETADWVRANAIDQKQLDAIALLERMVVGDLVQPEISEPFEHTNLWARAVQDWRHMKKCDTPLGEERLLNRRN